MAEIAAGALVAEQVISTTVEAGVVAGYAVAKPTMPLKVIFTQIGKAPQEDTDLALARSHHTLNVVANKAYIFGGETVDGQLASNHIHTVALPSSVEKLDAEYACLPSLARDEGGEVPNPRTRHATCVQGHELALFGGCDQDGKVVDEDSCLWVWNTETFKWNKISTISEGSTESLAPPPRYDHKLFAYGGHLILHGGRSSDSELLNDTWFFDFTAHIWQQLPDSPVHSDSVGLADGSLYAISKSPAQGLCHVYTLDIKDHVPSPKPSEGLEWHKIPTPSGEPAPGPIVRTGAGVVPVTTGYGRLYLSYIFGSENMEEEEEAINASSDDGPRSYLSDFWTYQLPSKSTKPTSWTDFKPAAIKDTIRQKLGYSSGGHEWAEVEVEASEQIAAEGKVHPGPRAFFGCDAGEDGRTIVLWGGVNAKGEKEADGWLIKLQ